MVRKRFFIMKLTLIILNSWHFNSEKVWYGMLKRGGYAPSALRILASVIPRELDVEISFLDENIERINFDKIDADLVGISVMTPNAPRAYQISDDLRKRGITVVLGGYHVTVRPDEAYKHADSVVLGFAESSFPELLRDFVNGGLKERYSGNSGSTFVDHKPLFANPPDYNKRYIMPGTMEISRGCTHNCSFCVISSFCSGYVNKTVESVIEEIKFIGKRKIVFLDFSPFEDHEYAMELFDAIRPLKIRWYSCMTTKNAEDGKFVSKAAESGCSGVLTGFESINPTSLSAGNKSFNEPDRYLEIISNLKNHRIVVLGSFIFGFDEDDKNIFKDTLDFIRKSKIDLLHYAIVTPFPGTEYFKQLEAENRITTYDWSRYDGTHVVYKPLKMSAQELQAGYFEIYKKSHSAASIMRRVSQSRWNLLERLATNIGFRLYIHSFIRQYNREIAARGS